MTINTSSETEALSAHDYERDQTNRRQERHDDQRDMAASISANTARIDAIERSLLVKDGSIIRLEAKFDATAIRTDEKLDALKMWMMGSMFTALLAVVGIAVSMVTRTH
jgi:hypothetical protein